MTSKLTTEQQLELISRAWGKQSGYCFFPHIEGSATCREERIRGYHEGPAFLWPKDRDKILAWMELHQDDDLYWCPSLFEKKHRQMELAMDEHCLWADLDEVDPREIDDYPPTIAWETSPGRYQALWLITGGDVQGASWQGGENQKLTYYLGADQGGWDTTQLLRIPGWKNHKPEHRGGTKEGPNPHLKPARPGKLLWRGGRRYLPDEFEDLPEVSGGAEIQDVLEDEITAIDRQKVWGRVRLKVSKEVRDLIAAREVAGDRSEKLWQIERDLADAGCTVTEIVAIVRATVWNKYVGRNDELKRLVTEASKAIGERSAERSKEIEEERAPKPKPTRLFDLLRDAKMPEWLVKNLWAQGACGFIAGQPKSFKSWCGLDLAMSVASGIPFLGRFEIVTKGPVLYIQEEDGIPMVKQRVGKVWPSKLADKMVVEDGRVVWLPPAEAQDGAGPDIAAYIGEGFTISDGGWQAWLDETLEEGLDSQRYVLVVIDPLMMVAGDVEENRAQEMTEKVFKPLKQLARKHSVAMALVHHMRKGDPTRPQRGGQLMLGSVANHAWAEDSLYLKLGRRGSVMVERESKHTTSGKFRVTGLANKLWTPSVVDEEDDTEEAEGGTDGQVRRAPPRGKKNGTGAGSGGRRRAGDRLEQVLDQLGPRPHHTQTIAEAMNLSRNGAYKQLSRAAERGIVEKLGGGRWMPRLAEATEGQGQGRGGEV